MKDTDILETEDVSFDLSIADLMASVLLIFILLLCSVLLSLQKEYEVQNNIAANYRGVQKSILDSLENEFSQELTKWDAEIDPVSLAFRFKDPNLLFLPNKAQLRPKFKAILNDFFPRYINVLYPEYISTIEEIRIEGHTAHDSKYSYLSHMKLSQDRTNEVLWYISSSVLNSMDNKSVKWVQSSISASGLADSRPILNNNGKVNYKQSRRVEFRIKTNSEKQIKEILQQSEALK